MDAFESLLAATDKSGREITEFFLELPSAEEYPDYYEVIKKPISLQEIKVEVQMEFSLIQV
jgi:hypothetical protein